MAFTNRQKFRVGGSGFTAFYWQGSAIAFAQNVSVTSPQPIARPSVIQPMDARYPLQIITPGAIGEGYLEIGVLEMYNSKVWDRIIATVTNNSSARANDLADVFFTLAAVDKPIDAVKMVIPPKNLQGDTALKPYGEIYHNCVITAIDDGEQINVAKMEIVKNVTIAYTHATRTDANTSPAGVQATQPSAGNILNNYSEFI